MLSLNVPVPGTVTRLAGDLRPHLSAFDRLRERHTLVVKRFEDDERADRVRKQLRRAIRPTPAFQARTAGVGVFESPVRGPGPVVYLAIDAPELLALHDRLCEAFGTIEELEGAEYVPHVTLARGGTREAAERIRTLDVDDVTWTVSRLQLWDPEYREAVGSIPLPVR
jgi:2'-5' RNA ligase